MNLRLALYRYPLGLGWAWARMLIAITRFFIQGRGDGGAGERAFVRARVAGCERWVAALVVIAAVRRLGLRQEIGARRRTRRPGGPLPRRMRLRRALAMAHGGGARARLAALDAIIDDPARAIRALTARIKRMRRVRFVHAAPFAALDHVSGAAPTPAAAPDSS